MIGRPIAAKGFPWLTHRTVAEIESNLDTIEKLDAISRQRRLTYRESRALENLIYGGKAA